MKSKTFYSKFMKTSFVKQLWIMALTAFGYFLVMLLPLAVMINNWQERNTYRWERRVEDYTSFMLQADGAYVLLVVLAVVMAVIQFSYLHSRRQTDFYGSLPIKREVLFSQRVLFSYIDFVIPYTIVLALCVIIGVVHNLIAFSAENLILYVLEMWIINQVGFMIMFLTCSLAMLLTGRKWVGFFGSCIFLSGGYLLYVLLDGLNSAFFQTYYSMAANNGLFWLSPVYIVYKMRDMIFELEEAQIFISGRFAWTLFAAAAIVVLLFLLDRYVVRKRAAEKAGQSMAFSVPARLIHLVLSIAGGAAIGLMTMTFIYANQTVWFIAGAVFGTFFLYVLIQFIYTLDIRRTFMHKWQIVAAEVVVILICCIYKFDLLGYDLYIPDQEDLESVAIRYQDDSAYSNYYSDGIYYNGVEYAFEKMVLEADDGLYAMLEDAVYKSDEGYSLNSVYVRYRLKNGRKVDRAYQVSLEEHKDTLIHLYEQEHFRRIMIPTLLDEMLKHMKYEDLRVYYAGINHTIYSVDHAGCISDFMDVYNEEIKKLDASVFVESVPIATLNIYAVGTDSRYGTNQNLPIYRECTQTLALLKELGHDPVEAMSPKNIQKIEVTDLNFDNTELYTGRGPTVQETTSVAEKEKTYIITDKEDIAAILSCMIEDDYSVLWQPRESGYDIRVYMENAEPGYDICCYGSFCEGQVPIEVLEGALADVVY